MYLRGNKEDNRVLNMYKLTKFYFNGKKLY